MQRPCQVIDIILFVVCVIANGIIITIRLLNPLALRIRSGIATPQPQSQPQPQPQPYKPWEISRVCLPEYGQILYITFSNRGAYVPSK